jgi:hypothetical protein
MAKANRPTNEHIRYLIRANGSINGAAASWGVARSTFQKWAKEAMAEEAQAEDANPDIVRLQTDLQARTDEVNRLNAQLRAAHRDNALYQQLASDLESLVAPLKPLPPAKKSAKRGQVVESLVLHQSDEHADQIVQPHRVGGLEDYNLRVAMARAEKLVDSTIQYSQETLSNYRFPTLWILRFGDHVSGEIHDAKDHSEYRNILKNCIAVGQLHALMIRDLAPHFEKVNVLYLPGNHGRRSKKKDFHGAHDNWDYLIGSMCQLLCQDIGNVDFIIPDSFSWTVEIEGYTFCVQHGDDIRAWNGIPHYGIERKTRRLTALHAAESRQIHYFVMGHFHQRSQMSHPSGEVLINGPWLATDEYSYNNLGAVTKPSQLIHGVHRKHGVTWRLPVDLKFDGDTDGPQRYGVAIPGQVASN